MWYRVESFGKVQKRDIDLIVWPLDCMSCVFSSKWDSHGCLLMNPPFSGVTIPYSICLDVHGWEYTADAPSMFIILYTWEIMLKAMHTFLVYLNFAKRTHNT